MSQDWKVGHDSKRDRFVRQVHRFTGYVNEALGQELQLKRDIHNINQGVEVADKVLNFSSPNGGSTTYSSPNRGSTTLLVDSFRRNRSTGTPEILSNISKETETLVNIHQTMSAAAASTTDPVQVSMLTQGMSAVKSVFESAIKAENSANTQAQGRGKKSAKAYSCNFI